MKYVVTGYKFDREFTNEREARVCFNKVKNNFIYCELKKVNEDGTHYYATSLEIYQK